MGKAYSVDLRLRVLAAIDAGLSKMQAHKTFQISRSTIDDWLKLRAQTGSVQDPQPRHSGRGLAAQQDFAVFAQRHQHSTLEQAQHTGTDAPSLAARNPAEREHHELFQGITSARLHA